eukprot:CAMPEP_0201569430 /NCGR_PEP_ID=MMETSP0190_2-20130828/11086_1 /ASSEMBLY_ACC=CAM_ASM_000263 /TAXON_ID=37353 /ORGANISM="Rosalina sp." /LENGTH=469 /DNA_ID=CAMNT_0047991711 /DNA_START=15 /DNA_END=1424 /DNA_ORIENTATION=+
MFHLVVLYYLFGYATSCSLAIRGAGELYIDNIQLLASDSTSVLLTITRSDGNWGGDSWCKVMSIEDGTVGPTIECSTKANDIKEWTSADTEPTSTVVNSVSMDKDGLVTLSITRNSEELTIETLSYSNPSITSTDFPYFTLNSIYTTFIEIDNQMIGVTFTGLDDNSYTVQRINPVGDAFETYWYTLGSPSNVYESMGLISFPDGGAACSSHFLAVYDYNAMTLNPLGPVLTATELLHWAKVDGDNYRIFSIGSGQYEQYVKISNMDTSRRRLTTYTDYIHYPNLCEESVACFADPCDDATCNNWPEATCVADYCSESNCAAKWFQDGYSKDCDACLIQCFVNPCETATCDQFPDAECSGDCCSSTWTYNGNVVDCETGDIYTPAPTEVTPEPTEVDDDPDCTAVCDGIPCDEETVCPIDPDATCSSVCCSAVWTDSNGEVINDCSLPSDSSMLSMFYAAVITVFAFIQ